MRYTIRKQTQTDFEDRVRRLDPDFARHGHRPAGAGTKARPSPVGGSLLGFGWVYVAASVARNREYLQDSLGQGSLSAQSQTLVMAGLAAMLVLSALAILVHLGRVLLRGRGRRGNSGAILTGAAAALTLAYTPPSVMEVGLGLLDPHASALLQTASATVGVDFENVAFVSSR